jgi:hypothetical protein
VTATAAVVLLPLALAWLGIAAWIALDDHRWGRHVDQALAIANTNPDTELADLLGDRIPPNPLQPGREQL